MSSSSSNTFNGLTYEQTINDLVFYHTLEVVATPTSDPNFQPTVLEAFNPQQYVNTPNTAVGALKGLFVGQGSLTADGFLAQFNQFNLPGSWSSFAAALKTYDSALTDAQIAGLENQFISDYEYALRFPTSYANGGGVGSSEWDNVIRGLANQITTSPDGLPTDADLQTAYNSLSASMKSQFEASFSNYIQSYPYTQTTKTIVNNGVSSTVNTGVQVPVAANDLGINFQNISLLRLLCRIIHFLLNHWALDQPDLLIKLMPLFIKAFSNLSPAKIHLPPPPTNKTIKIF